MVQLADYEGLESAWCPGCGNFGILKALKTTLVDLGLEPWQVLVVSGIGQAGKLPHFMKCNTFNSLHGRPVPPAVAAKVANPELTVIGVSGDGDGYGEGGNHFIHAMRRNHDITYMVHNNQIYGLTKGQASPTSDEGTVTKTTLYGAPAPLNPLALAIVMGATFVARGFAGDAEHLSELLKAGINHKGFALVDILQPCVSFNHVNTFKWYQDRVYKLDDGYDPTDKMAALEKAMEWGDKIPNGILYRTEKDSFEDHLPAQAKGPLVTQDLKSPDIEKLLDEML